MKRPAAGAGRGYHEGPGPVSLAAEMQACLGGVAGCRAALLVDLDAGMALAASGPEGAAEDAGSTLAAAACELLGRARPAALAAVGDGDHAVIASAGALHVVQRLRAVPDRALVLTFDPGAEPDAALAHARSCQAAVAAAGLW